MAHPTKLVPELGAQVDIEAVPLVLGINRLGFPTTSSCQGSPGKIGEGGAYGHVAFRGSDRWHYERLALFVFSELREVFGGMYDDVRLEVSLSESRGFIGWLRFRNEALPAIISRIGEVGKHWRVG